MALFLFLQPEKLSPHETFIHILGLLNFSSIFWELLNFSYIWNTLHLRSLVAGQSRSGTSGKILSLSARPSLTTKVMPTPMNYQDNRFHFLPIHYHYMKLLYWFISFSLSSPAPPTPVPIPTKMKESQKQRDIYSVFFLHWLEQWLAHKSSPKYLLNVWMNGRITWTCFQP